MVWLNSLTGDRARSTYRLGAETLPQGGCTYLLWQGGEKALLLLSWFLPCLSRPKHFPNSALSHPCRFLSSATSIANNNSSKFSSPGAQSVAMAAVQPRCISLCLPSICGSVCVPLNTSKGGQSHTPPAPPAVQFGMQYPAPGSSLVGAPCPSAGSSPG